MQRKKIAGLCLCVLILLSGCGSETTTMTPAEKTSTPPMVSTPPVDDCTTTSPVNPKNDSGVEPLQYPDFPSDVSKSTAETYVETFYRATIHNRQLERYEYIAGGLSVSTSTDEIGSTGDGWLVSVTTDVAITEAYDEPIENHTSTPTPAVGDEHFSRSETYYITDRFLIKVSSETTVACASP